ncbi:MAG: glutamate--tRNA ligase, partial [Cytophagaceae bacterium]
MSLQTNNKQPTIGRLAPTPSGYLHLGNAVNFVLTWLLVRQAGGTLHLRIDDLDRARLR